MPKQTADQIRGLGLSDFPGRLVVSLPIEKLKSENACVKCYAAFNNQDLGSDAASQLVRLNLFAECDNQQDHVASAVLPAGFAGGVFSVTGHPADSWHVYAQATLPTASIRVGLCAVECGCSDPIVVVNPLLKPAGFSTNAIVPLTFRRPDLLFIPWGRTEGEYTSVNFSPLPAAMTLFGSIQRAKHIVAVGGALDSILTFGSPNPLTTSALLVPAGATREFFPDSDLLTDRVTPTTALASFTLESVR